MTGPNAEQKHTTGPGPTAVLTVFLVAAALRFGALTALPYEPDEAWEVTHNSANPVELIWRVEGFPPLHGMVLGVLLEATGSDASARWLSAVLGLATLGVVLWIGRLVGGGWPAWWACAFLAVSPFHVAISRSARPYSLFIFITALAIGSAFWVRGRGGRRAGLAFVASGWAVVATSYPGGLLVALLLAAMALVPPRVQAKRVAASIVGLTAACLPLIGCLWIDLVGVQEDFFHRVLFDKEVYLFTYLEMLTGASVGPSINELSNMPSREGLIAMAPWALAAFAPAAVLTAAACRRLRRETLATLLLLLVGAPLLLGALSPLLQTGYATRYIAWMILPAVLLLAGGAGLSRRRPLASAATVALLGVNLLGVYNHSRDGRYRSYDFRPVAQRINKEFADAPILAAPPYLAAAVRYNLQTADRPVLDAFATTMLDKPDESRRWLEALVRLDQRMIDHPACALVIQATPDNDQRQPTLLRYAGLLGAEPLGEPCPSVALYRVRREALARAIAALRKAPNDDANSAVDSTTGRSAETGDNKRNAENAGVIEDG